MKQWRKDRLARLADKRDWSPAKLDAVAEKIEKRQERAKTVLSKIVSPVAAAVVSGVPGGAIVGNIINKIPVVNKLPVLADVAKEGTVSWEADQKAGIGLFGRVWRDIVPMWREIEEGDYKGALKAAPVALGTIVGLLALIGLI